MEGQSGLSELSVISWVSTVEGVATCPLSGIPLYFHLVTSISLYLQAAAKQVRYLPTLTASLSDDTPALFPALILTTVVHISTFLGRLTSLMVKSASSCPSSCVMFNSLKILPVELASVM